MGVLSAVYRYFHPLYASVRSSALVIRTIFGVKIPPGQLVHWDTTTVLLKKSLERTVQPGDRVLEMGIGQAALLSIWVKKKLQPSQVDGVDVSPSRVDSAKQVIEHNAAGVTAWCSDLFASVPEKYDVIFFNPPYVRTSAGRKLRLTEMLAADGDQVWDGGEFGTDVIFMFLKAAMEHLKTNGRILIGVQDYYVKGSQIEEIALQFGYELSAVDSSMLNPSVVYTLKAKPA